MSIYESIFSQAEIYDDVLQFVFDIMHCDSRPEELTPVSVPEAAGMLETWRMYDDGDLPPGINPEVLARAWNTALECCRENYFGI